MMTLVMELLPFHYCWARLDLSRTGKSNLARLQLLPFSRHVRFEKWSARRATCLVEVAARIFARVHGSTPPVTAPA